MTVLRLTSSDYKLFLHAWKKTSIPIGICSTLELCFYLPSRYISVVIKSPGLGFFLVRYNGKYIKQLYPRCWGGGGSCCSIFEVLCRSLFVLLSFFLAISLSVLLLFTDSDYTFGILSSSYYRNKTLKTLISHWISQLSCQVDLIDNSVTKRFSLFIYLKQLNNQMSSSAIIYVFKCDYICLQVRLYMSHLYLYSCVPINSECPL